jgi:hypothetical protein
LTKATKVWYNSLVNENEYTKEVLSMTKRELFEAIVAKNEVTDEMVAKAQECLVALDKRSDKPSKNQVENEAYKAEIYGYLVEAGVAVTAAKVAEDTGIVKGKVVALLGQLAKAGKVIAEKGKGKAPMSYQAVAEE